MKNDSLLCDRLREQTGKSTRPADNFKRNEVLASEA